MSPWTFIVMIIMRLRNAGGIGYLARWSLKNLAMFAMYGWPLVYVSPISLFVSLYISLITDDHLKEDLHQGPDDIDSKALHINAALVL